MSKFKKAVTVLIIVAFIVSAVSWAATSDSMSLPISTGGTLSDGSNKVAKVTQLSSNLTITQGRAQKIEGVGLFEIETIPTYSDQLRIHIMEVAPENIRGLLNNPGAFIDVAVWYEDVNSLEMITDAANLTVKVSKDPSPNAQSRMSEQIGDVVLRPSMAAQSRVFIIASITTPGGFPSGVQSQLGQFEFYCDVRM